MEVDRMSKALRHGLGTRLASAAQLSMEYSVYQAADLTTAQTLVLALFGNLLKKDVAGVLGLLPAISTVPELQSSSVAVWLREDFCFERQDVTSALSCLASFLQESGPLLPLHVLVIFSGLEEKYDVFESFREAGDTVGMEMLAYLNPLVTRATQAGPQLKHQSVDARPATATVATQTSKKDRKANVIPPNLVQGSADFSEKIIAEGKDSGPSSVTSLRPTSVTSFSIDKKIPVVYATSHSVESIPIETISEFRPEDQGDSDVSRATFQPSTSSNTSSQNQITLADFKSSRPLPSAPSLAELYSILEPGYEAEPSTEEPIYENIEVFHKKIGLETEHQTGRVAFRRRNLQQLDGNIAMKNLLKAAARGDTATAAKALSMGAHPDCKDTVRRTPLHLAVVNGQHLLVQLLLEAGAQKDVKDSLGRTPLHYSALKGRIDCAQILLESGANPNIRDNSGMTPTALATMKHHSGVAVLLKRKGGQECSIS